MSNAVKRLHMLIALCFCLAAGALLAACGDDASGGSGERLDESTNAETVLDRTFSDESRIESADLSLFFGFAVEGRVPMTFEIGVTGPFDSSGDGFPKFDFEATLKGRSPERDLDSKVGATSTGEATFVSYEGQDYAVDQATFDFLKGAFEAAEPQSTDEPQDVPKLRDYLIDVRNEGVEDVEGTETVHVSGAVDVPALIERLRPLAAQADALGLVGPTGGIPSPAELNQLGKLVKSATFDVYSGSEDNLLRRFQTTVRLDQPRGQGKATIQIDLALGDVNEPQQVQAPADPRPLGELLDKLNVDPFALGALGGLEGIGSIGDAGAGDDGAGAGGTGPAGGTGGTGAPLPPEVPSPEQAQDYIDCMNKVVTAADLQRCQRLIR
jgi:hypothetical protein